MIEKLSFQTWYIHSLSVIDWLLFIELLWQYAYQLKLKHKTRFHTQNESHQWYPVSV